MKNYTLMARMKKRDVLPFLIGLGKDLNRSQKPEARFCSIFYALHVKSWDGASTYTSLNGAPAAVEDLL